MAIQNINELYDRLSQDEIFSSSGLNSAEELKGYLEKLPDENKQSFYDAFLQDEDINFDQFNNLLKKKEQGRTGILSSALGSIDLGSPSGSNITEPQTVTPEVKAPEVTPIAETTTAPPIAEEEMGIEDFSVSGVKGGPLDGSPGKPKPSPTFDWKNYLSEFQRKYPGELKPQDYADGTFFDKIYKKEGERLRTEFNIQSPKQLEQFSKGEPITAPIFKDELGTGAQKKKEYQDIAGGAFEKKEKALKPIRTKLDVEEQRVFADNPIHQFNIDPVAIAEGREFVDMKKAKAKEDYESEVANIKAKPESIYNKINSFNFIDENGNTSQLTELSIASALFNNKPVTLSPRDPNARGVSGFRQGRLDEVNFKNHLLSIGFGEETADQEIARLKQIYIEDVANRKMDDLKNQILIESGNNPNMANKRFLDYYNDKAVDLLSDDEKEGYNLAKHIDQLYDLLDKELKKPGALSAQNDKIESVKRNIEILQEQLNSIRENPNNLYDWRTGQFINKSITDKRKFNQIQQENKEFQIKYGDQPKDELIKKRDRLIQQREEIFNLMKQDGLEIPEKGTFASAIKAMQISAARTAGTGQIRLPDGSYTNAAMYEKKMDEYNKQLFNIERELYGINRAVMLNEDVALREKVERGFIETGVRGVGSFVGTALKSIGRTIIPGSQNEDAKADWELRNSYFPTLEQSGFVIAPSLKSAARKDVPELISDSAGTLLEAMVGIAVGNAFLPAVKSLKWANKFKDILSKKYGKIGESIFDTSADMIRSGAIFEAAGQGFATGVGEQAGQAVFDFLDLDKFFKGKARLLEYLGRVIAGGSAETVQEYAGQYLQTLADQGIDIEKNFKTAFGRDSETALDQFLQIAITSALFSGVSNGKILLASRKRLNEILTNPGVASQYGVVLDENTKKEIEDVIRVVDDKLNDKTTMRTSEAKTKEISEDYVPASTITVEPAPEMEAPGGVTPPVAEGAEAAAFEQGEGPIEAPKRGGSGMRMVRSIKELKAEVELMKQGKDTLENRLKIAEFEKEIAEQERLGLGENEGRLVSGDLAIEETAPIETVGAQPVNAQEVNNQLAKEGINDVSLQRVEEYGKEIESGNVDFERFSPSEQRGLIEGGPVHVEATIITGKSDRAADTQDDSNDRQEDVVKEYAQKKGIWLDNAPAKLTEKYGDPFQSGKESLVWLDEARGVVVKSSVTDQYPTLREALDSITLSNAYFPAAKITVVGFGTNKDGDFEIITEQPYIQGEDATEQDIKDYFNKLGFTENERLYQGKDAFGNEEVIFKDAAPKNVIKTPEGNIVPIDLIAKINKPELNANGTRTLPSTVAEEVTEAAPEAVGAQLEVTEQAPETKAEAPKEYGAQNKIVTKQDYDQAVKNLRNPNLPSGFDFSKIGDLVKAAMYHIEAGSRKFADFTKKMVEQFGRGVKQYLPNVFRRANTQLQQQQVAAPTPAPAAPVVKTSAQIKQEINQTYNDYTAQNPNATPEQIGAHLEAKGYSIGQIKRFIPQIEDYIKKESVRKFEDFVKNFQDKISKRRAEIEKFMESNPGLDYAQVYQQLKDQYSDFELFKMFYEDGADTDVLDELFGTEYRQTIQRAIDSKNYNPDFIREIDDDIRSRKTLKNLGEANSIFTELQDFATAEQLVEAAADVFEMSGVEEAMKTVTDKVRAQNRNNLENFQKMLKGEEMTEEQILSMTSLLSFSGRILRMGRGLFMTQKGLTDLIIKNLETATLRESQLFTKKKKLFKVTEEQRKKIEAGVKKYLETKTEFEKATKDLEEGANALTDPKFEAFDKAKAEHEKAARELKDFINKLYGSRKPLFSRFITSMTSMALLSFRTIFIGIPSNIEQMLANMPRRGVGKVLGWTRILADKAVGSQIALKIMGGKNLPLAAEALKRGTGVSVDPSLYRKMAAQRGWDQTKAIVFKGVSQSTVSEKNFLEGGAEIDGVRDFKMSYRMIAKLIEGYLPNKKSFTDEEWADAFDKVLVAMEQKDANGKPVLALQHSQGYDTIATFFRGLFGVLPTITGRAIALSGDRYFQQLGMYEFLASYANSMGITDPVEVQRFIRLNSIGSGELRKAAEKAGNRRIFATDNQVVNWFGKMMGGFEKKEEEIYNRKLKQYSKGKKTAAMVQNLNAVPSVAKRIALNINAPFVRIPTNALAKYFRITSTPTTLILAVRAQMKLSQEMRNYQENYGLDKNAKMSETKKKKMEADRVKLFEQQRLAAQYWTEFFQGLQLTAFAVLLLKSGAVGAPYGDDDEAKKRARAAGIAQQDPAKINISQLIRYIKGETRGQTIQKGDITFDYRNLGMMGFALSAICSGESFYRVQKAKQEKMLGIEEDLAGMIGFQMVAESLSNGATQLSFIQNIATLATAVKGDLGKAFKDYMTGITTTALTVPTLSYGIFSPVERTKGISADPFRNFNPDLEANEVFNGEITARVWTKLTSRSPLFGFGIRVSDEPDSDFVAPLEVLGLRPSEFYRPQYGPSGEELYKKSTFWDTRSGSASDKFLAFLQASIDPFSFSDYEGFVSNVKPFDKNKEYKKGDYFEYDNSVYVALTNKKAGVEFSRGKIDKDFQYVDKKTDFVNPERFKNNKIGSEKTATLFDMVDMYERATGDRKNYDIFSRIYSDPVTFKDNKGTYALYVSSEDQRKLQKMRGQVLVDAWSTSEANSLMEGWKKMANNPNITDEEYNETVKNEFLDWMLGPLDTEGNRSGGVKSSINEALNALESDPDFDEVKKNAVLNTVKSGRLTVENFKRLLENTEAFGYLNSLRGTKIKLRDGEYNFE